MIGDFIKQFYPVRRFAAVMGALLAIYIWAGFAGCKLTGDDNSSTGAEPKGARTGNHFYHK